jgi:hypothetical protein
MAWLSGWSKRKKVTLTGGASGAQTAFQLKLSVTHDSDMQADFDDLRFTQSDGTTLVDCWLESKTDSTSAIVWVEFPTTPANGVDQDYYMYYGNTGASNVWSGDNTFIIFDDFETGVDGYNGGTQSSDYAHTGTYSLKLPGATEAAKDYTLPTHPFVMDRSVYMPSGQTGILGAAGLQSDNRINLLFAGHPTVGNWGYRDSSGGYTDSGIAYLTDQWIELSMVMFAGTTWSAYQNATTIISGLTSFSHTDVEKVYHYGYTDNNCYIDDIRVRKYAVNPSTYAFGSEETVPAGTIPVIIHHLRQQGIL